MPITIRAAPRRCHYRSEVWRLRTKTSTAVHVRSTAHDRMRRTAPIGLARHGGRIRNRDRARMPRRALDEHEDVLRVPQRVRRPAELERLPGVPRSAGVAPGPQREGDRVDRADRAGARLDDRAGLAVPPEELFLSRHAE